MWERPIEEHKQIATKGKDCPGGGHFREANNRVDTKFNVVLKNMFRREKTKVPGTTYHQLSWDRPTLWNECENPALFSHNNPVFYCFLFHLELDLYLIIFKIILEGHLVYVVGIDMFIFNTCYP